MGGGREKRGERRSLIVSLSFFISRSSFMHFSWPFQGCKLTFQVSVSFLGSNTIYLSIYLYISLVRRSRTIDAYWNIEMSIIGNRDGE